MICLTFKFDGFGFCCNRFFRTQISPLATTVLLLFVTTTVVAQDQHNPLAPLDHSSPRATLKLFLESSDNLGEFVQTQLMPTQSKAKFIELVALIQIPVECLDLREVSPAARLKTARAAAVALYETMSRISLPPENEWPDAFWKDPVTGKNLDRWVIPNTEIALVRQVDGPRSGEYLFSAETVARADEFYQRVEHLSYTRIIPFEGMHQLVISGGGWLIPYSWIRAMPQWLQMPVAEQSGWKWFGLILLLGLLVPFLRWAGYLSRLGEGRHPFLVALAKLVVPVFVIVGTQVVTYLALVHVNLVGHVGVVLGVISTVVMYLTSTFLALRLAPVIAEAIISSPEISTESLDAHVIRIAARLLGIVGGIVLLAIGADRLGIPVYGVVAGLGVGGLAMALAAQSTIENLIGGMSLFADKPIKVGDRCEYGGAIGFVEAIGFRSTRIRGTDRSLTSIPNAMLSKIPIVNLTNRDQMEIRTLLGLRYETSPEQLRFVLVKLREMLLGHPLIHPDPARVRLVEFGDSSLNIDIKAYAMTRDWEEFHSIREDILLRIIDIIESAGASFAFQSRTLYFKRDSAKDDEAAQSAESQVQEWRSKGELPFPNFTAGQAREIKGSITYPPPGSVESPLSEQPSVRRPDKK